MKPSHFNQGGYDDKEQERSLRSWPLDGERDDTEYLLSSTKMKERLLAALYSSEGIPFEVVLEELGI